MPCRHPGQAAFRGGRPAGRPGGCALRGAAAVRGGLGGRWRGAAAGNRLPGRGGTGAAAGLRPRWGGGTGAPGRGGARGCGLAARRGGLQAEAGWVASASQCHGRENSLRAVIRLRTPWIPGVGGGDAHAFLPARGSVPLKFLSGGCSLFPWLLPHFQVGACEGTDCQR